MASRVEKYQSYRQEIINDSSLINHLENKNKVIIDYQNKIDQINKNILKDLKIEINYPEIHFQDDYRFEALNSFDHVISLFDSQLLSDINQEIVTANKNQVSSILNKSHEFKKDWLLQNKNYYSLNETQKKLRKVQKIIDDFAISSNASVEKIQAIISKKETIPKIEILKPDIFSSKNKWGDYSKVSLILSIIIFLTIISAFLYILVELIIT